MKTLFSFQKPGQAVLAALVFIALGTGATFAQSLAAARQPEFSSLSATSNGLTVVAYQVPGTTKFKMHLQSLSGEKIRIVLRNDRHESVYVENVSDTKKGYARGFDMKDMADGTYRFEISDGTQKIFKEISLQTVRARSLNIQ